MIPLPDSPFQYYNNNQRGFTLIELPIIVAVIAILLAIAAPSFLAFLNRAKIVDAIGKVQGALKEAQTEAIRKSKSCSVALKTADGKLSSPCLVTGDRVLPEGVSMVTNVPGGSPEIRFSFRGNTTSSGKVVVYMEDGSDSKKCLVISNGVGIMRTGDYSGSTSPTSAITAGTCTTSQ